jgi:hypothetical protein
MRELNTEIEIEASAEKVWSTLTDFARYHEWNPFIPKIAGDLRNGAKVQIHLHIPNEKKETAFTATILNIIENETLSWVGKLAGGMFVGKRRFVIEPINENRVRFTHSEKFNGILVGILGKKIDNARLGFEEMNKALKARAEK